MRTLRFLLMPALVAIGMVWAPPDAQAQCIGTLSVTCTTRTTLSANATATDQTISVTSATGFTVDNFIWVDFELMRIVSVTGTQIQVARGQRGTIAQAHDNADAVLTGTGTGGPFGAGHFNTRDPDFGQDCTRGEGQASHLPFINIRTGWVWTCDVGTDWTATTKPTLTLNSDPTSF